MLPSCPKLAAGPKLFRDDPHSPKMKTFQIWDQTSPSRPDVAKQTFYLEGWKQHHHHQTTNVDTRASTTTRLVLCCTGVPTTTTPSTPAPVLPSRPDWSQQSRHGVPTTTTPLHSCQWGFHYDQTSDGVTHGGSHHDHPPHLLLLRDGDPACRLFSTKLKKEKVEADL